MALLRVRASACADRRGDESGESVNLPNSPLLSRGLMRAIALLEAGLTGGLSCRDLLKGERPSAVRKELNEYKELLSKMGFRQKGAAS